VRDDRPLAQLEVDLEWVRRTLAPADPIQPGDRHLVAMPASMTDPHRLERPRRRSAPILVTAMAAAAVLVLGLVAVAAQRGTKPAHGRTSVSGPAAVLAAYSTTLGAQSAQGSVLLSVDGTSMKVEGSADLHSGAGDLTLTLPAPVGQVEVLSTGQEYFVHLPSQLKTAAGGKPWVRVDRGTLEGLGGGQLGVSGLGTTLDFSGVLGWLRGVSGHIGTVGSQAINGTPTTHYRARVDVSRVAAGMGVSANTASAIAQVIGQTVPVDVWIDAQGRLRQMKVSLDLTSLHLPQGVTLPAEARGTAVLTIDLWNFGVTVHPVPPPADQVGDASSLLGPLAGRTG
jgi:hypothetical protein